MLDVCGEPAYDIQRLCSRDANVACGGLLERDIREKLRVEGLSHDVDRRASVHKELEGQSL